MSFTPSENPITNPTRESYTELRPFRFWCQKVLPLVYDDSLSYYELLCKVVDYLNKTMEDVDHMNTDMDTLYSNFQEFQTGTFRIYNELVDYVNTYFDELDVQEEINTKLDEMVTSGELTTILSPTIANEVSTWLSEHLTPTSPTVDDTLTISGAAADAKTVGNVKVSLTKSIDDLKSDLRQITAKDQNITALSIWSNKRVTTDGSLTYSPSQLTSEEIFYIGKGNIIKITGEDDTSQLSISYYQYSNGEYNYIQSDVSTVRFLKYVCAKYDYCRISFVRTSTNPPVLTEFSVEIFQTVNHEFYGKNISFLGDSITTFDGVSEWGGSYNAPYYPTGDVSYYEQTYGKMFWDACGGVAISVSAISSSAWRNQGQASCPSAYEDTRITRLSANGTPDYVLINMGTNDPYSNNIGSDIGYTYDVETLEANVVYSSYAIQTTIRKIQVAYPNAKIILLIPKFPSAIGTGNYTFEKWEKLCDFMVQIANMYGAYKIVDMRKCGISVETFSTDCIASGMHPNFSGMKKMGTYLIKELLLA